MILINGKQSDTINIHDRGLLYGDGVFETIAVINGVPQYFDRHLDRLLKGCQSLLMPEPDISAIKTDVESVCDKQERYVLKITITRGTSERGYSIPEHQNLTRIIETSAFPDYPSDYAQDGINVMQCNNRLGINPALAGIKHLNRLEQILGRNELKGTGCFEGLMIDTDGHVIEGTMTNLFSIKAGKLFTPDLSRCGVAGVMREVVLQLAEKINLECEIGNVTMPQLLTSDEIFLTNSLIGICPVRQINEQKYIIGITTKKLQEQIQSIN